MTRIALAAVLAAGACSMPMRTTAASQPSPAAFDASASDPRALATADAGLAALGGYDRWQAVKELRFELHYVRGGKLAGWFQHRWDRWNGRHDFAMADGNSLGNDPSAVSWLDVKYDLFDADKLPFGSFGTRGIADEDAVRYSALARQRLNADGYLLTAAYKVRDPGVHLGDGGVVADIPNAPDLCKPQCVGVTVSFDPAIGTDRWQIDYNAATHLPQVLEAVVADGRIFYRIDGWSEAGGLRWPATLTNVAMSESFAFTNVAVGEPDDAYYERAVDRTQSNHAKSLGRPDPSHLQMNSPAGAPPPTPGHH
jgi:hypothetical protein